MIISEKLTLNQCPDTIEPQFCTSPKKTHRFGASKTLKVCDHGSSEEWETERGDNLSIVSFVVGETRLNVTMVVDLIVNRPGVAVMRTVGIGLGRERRRRGGE